MRSRIVAQARTWIDTPFKHQGRARGVGCDCIGLLTCAAQEIGLYVFNPTDYSNRPNGDFMLASCKEHLIQKDVKNIEVGDVLLMRAFKDPQHLTIVGDYAHGGFSIIHAYNQAGKVVESRLDSVWMSKVVAAFSIPGIEDEK